jgi:Mg-chelatase subunit ChlD
MKTSSKTLIVSVLSVLLAAGAVWAGNGKLNATTKKFDLSISIRGDYTDAQIDTLKGQMQKASDIIADATDGQHRFGRIYVCNKSRGGKSADAWRVPGTATPRSSANIRGLGAAGLRMYLEDDLATSNANADGAHVIAHEFGHYGYGIYDEYCKNCTSAASTVGECLATAGTASLMENFWTRPISELCLSTNHDPDKDTDQSALNTKADGNPESAWETAKRHFPDLTIPAAATDAAPASEAIDWKVLKPETRLVLVIDRSGSMAGSRMQNAIAGGILFVNLLRNDDQIGVIDFDDTVTTDLPLTLADAAGKAAATGAIAALTDRGATAVWDGLAAGVALMNATADPACQMIIILLTDGEDNSSSTTQAAATQAAKDAGIVVHTIGLGSGADAGLIAAAAATNGKFFQVNDPGALGAVFGTLQAESSTDGGVITKALAPLPSGGTASTDTTLDLAGRATFVLSWNDPTADLDLTLTAPDGSSPARATSGGTTFSSAATYEFFIIDNAAAGTWKMNVAHVSGDDVEYAVQSFGDNANASLTANLDQPAGTLYTYPTPVIVHAQPVSTKPIVGASVTMLVKRPDGSDITVPLFDDGDNAMHGDMQAEDGVYSARFRRFSGDGVYSFLVSATTAGAMLHSGEGLMDFPTTGSIGVSGASNTAAPSFTRTTELTATVEDAPFVNTFTPTLDKARFDFRKAKKKKKKLVPQDVLTARGKLPSGVFVDLSSETLELALGSFAKTLAPGSFKLKGKKLVAKGPGFTLTLLPKTKPTGTALSGVETTWMLSAKLQNLAATKNPVLLTLFFDRSEGSLTKTFREIVKRGKRKRLQLP